MGCFVGWLRFEKFGVPCRQGDTNSPNSYQYAVFVNGYGAVLWNISRRYGAETPWICGKIKGGCGIMGMRSSWVHIGISDLKPWEHEFLLSHVCPSYFLLPSSPCLSNILLVWFLWNIIALPYSLTWPWKNKPPRSAITKECFSSYIVMLVYHRSIQLKLPPGGSTGWTRNSRGSIAGLIKGNQWLRQALSIRRYFWGKGT